MTIIMTSMAGAALYRWRGGPVWLGGPRWLKLAALSLFLCLPLAAAGEWVRLTGAWPLAFYALSLAHGEFMDLAHRYGAGREESDWPWLPWALGWIGSRYWYEFAALAITGLAATLGPGLALVLLGDWSGWLLAAAGALKAPAYAIGWALARGSRATEIGEWLTGAAWGAVVGALL